MSGMSFLAIITISVEGGSQDLWRRKNSRILLLIWFRLTALPTFLLTIMPKRGLSLRLGRINTKKYRVMCLFVFRVVARYSLRQRSRFCLGNDWSGCWHSCLLEGQRIKIYEPFSAKVLLPRLYAKPFSALSPPAADDLSSTSCFHTSPKAMISFSSDCTGLIGTFHFFSSIIKLNRIKN